MMNKKYRGCQTVIEFFGKFEISKAFDIDDSQGDKLNSSQNKERYLISSDD